MPLFSVALLLLHSPSAYRISLCVTSDGMMSLPCGTQVSVGINLKFSFFGKRCPCFSKSKVMNCGTCWLHAILAALVISPMSV